MQDTDIVTKVILTQPQSFIEANLPRLCYLLTGINPIDNKSVSVSVFDNGGFQFTKLNENSGSYSQSGIKDKNDFLKLLDEFFSKKNQFISEAFANQKVRTQFFPRNYMKPISASPNYSGKGAVNAITSWTAVYKIEIPAYENPATRRTEYANLVNGGIEITLNTGGQITSLKYNLLPISSQKSARLYKVITDETELPQLAYLLNGETSTLAPFYLSNTEEAYIPATRDSILPYLTAGEPPFVNSTKFEEDKVVVWLKSTGKKKKLRVRDASAKKQIFSPNIKLPAGAKLIRLKPRSENDETTPCVYWWQGGYHQSDFPERSLGTSNVIITDFSGQVLQNDVEHLLSRILSYEKEKDEEYKKVINLIRNFSNKVLSKKQIEDGLVALNTSLKFNPNDKPATILSYQKALNDVYNPQVNDRTKFFDETLILPLSSVWFEQTDPSTKQSDPKLLSSLDKLKEWLVGNAGGEGLADPDQRLPDVKAELLNIKEYVDQTIVRNSPEAKWLQTLSPESLTKIKRIIFVHSETWNYSLGQKHVSGIAIQNSFGAFNLHPVINVLLHELTVNGGGSFLKFAKGTSPDGAGVDTHIPVQYTQATWDKVSKGGLGSLRGDEDFIDHLYQSHRALASIALAIIISKISNE